MPLPAARKPHRGHRRFIGSEAIGDLAASYLLRLTNEPEGARVSQFKFNLVYTPLMPARAWGTEQLHEDSVKDQSEDSIKRAAAS
jgi:hypothetical protein